jgi:uncharacterized protein YegP (UPF0339 family)
MADKELPAPRISIYERTDKDNKPLGEFGWRLRAGNGKIIATDGGQGYVNRSEAEDMAVRIIKNGEFKDAPVINVN